MLAVFIVCIYALLNYFWYFSILEPWTIKVDIIFWCQPLKNPIQKRLVLLACSSQIFYFFFPIHIERKNSHITANVLSDTSDCITRRSFIEVNISQDPKTYLWVPCFKEYVFTSWRCVYFPDFLTQRCSLSVLNHTNCMVIPIF